MLDKKQKSISLLVLFILALLLGLIFFWQRGSRTIEIKQDKEPPIASNGQLAEGAISPLSGIACQKYNQRSLAVVLASDPETRPLAGLSQADLVMEMPVVTDNITRMIAFYVCYSPEEIGSLRSARHDFIPLAMGMDAILVHWGGSHFALDQLDSGVMDNVNALTNPFNAFYQKENIPQPHNGFTSMERLIKAAKSFGYRLGNKFEGYPHFAYSKADTPNLSPKSLKIGYKYPHNVEYQYEPKTNTYWRYRGGQKEIDKNNNQQIGAKVVVAMRAFSRQIEGPDYNDLDIGGIGRCDVYQGGEVIPCTWRKDKNNLKSKLYFFDKGEKEIAFVPGQVWIEIVEPDQEIIWQ